MIIRIEAEDGQDVFVGCGELTGSIKIGILSDRGNGQRVVVEDFTIEETKAAIAALEFAIKIAQAEREEMEARNGH